MNTKHIRVKETEILFALNAWRKQRKFNQTDLAELIGVEQSTVSRILDGARNLRLCELIALNAAGFKAGL